MIATQISRASAACLAIGGFALLFASDAILPRLIPGLPESATWLGQLVAAAWLALASLNWLSRHTLLGGIYGRAVVAANGALYFISAMVLFGVVRRSEASPVMWLAVAVCGAFAAMYGWLTFRGPFARDFAEARGKPEP